MEVLWVLGWSRSSSTGSRMRATSPRDSARTSQPWAAAPMAPSAQVRLSSTTNRDLRVGSAPWRQHRATPCVPGHPRELQSCWAQRPKQTRFHVSTSGGAFEILIPRPQPKPVGLDCGLGPTHPSEPAPQAVCLAPHLEFLKQGRGFLESNVDYKVPAIKSHLEHGVDGFTRRYTMWPPLPSRSRLSAFAHQAPPASACSKSCLGD